MSVPPKKDFLGKPAPPGYIAGVGRGATGFTTRSDIGPAREAAASSSAADDRKALKRAHDDIEEEEYLNESNYDEFAGYGGSLFNKDPYEEDDEEADKIYDAIDKHMAERGKSRREAKARRELELYRQERPKIQQQFSDLKAALVTVTEEEWANIPEVGDARNRKQRVAQQDKFTPVPDSLLAHQAKLASGGEKLVYLDPKTLDADMSLDLDKPTPSGLNIGEMSEFRGSNLSMQLSRISNAVDSQIKANPEDYINNLQSMTPAQITDAATLKEYRKQFASLRKSNPRFANAWIASVRLEEAAGKLREARSLVIKACSECPKSADIWCEAVRFHPPDIAKGLMVKALKELPRSEKLWIRAADLEGDDESKKRVYANARKLCPKSVIIWKKSVELEMPPLEGNVSVKRENDSRRKSAAVTILREAVECCPESPELWLALARLEYQLGSYEKAQEVLIKASDKHPTDRNIWIEAAKLQEASGNTSIVENIISRAVEQLSEKGIEIKREEWFAEAIAAEKSNCRLTCRAIIKRIIGWNIPDKNRLKTWKDDAQRLVENNSFESARAVYECIVSDRAFCKEESNWISYAKLEEQNPDQLTTLLRRSIKNENCIRSENLWLMLAQARQHHLDETRQILSDALDANPKSEKIILAAVELEYQNGNSKEARRILADACMIARTPKLVIRSAELERSLGNLNEAMRMLREGIGKCKTSPDLYLMSGQIEEQRNDPNAARTCYSNGLKLNPESVELWISIANIEEKMGTNGIPKARAKLEMGRRRNPKVPELWLEAARLEARDNRFDEAMNLLAKGVRECRENPNVKKLEEEQTKLKKR